MLHLPPSPCPIFPGTVQSGRYGSEKIQIRQISSSTQRGKSSQLVRYIHHLKTEHLKSEHLTFWTLFLSGFQIVWSSDYAGHSKTGHFWPLDRHFLFGFQTTIQKPHVSLLHKTLTILVHYSSNICLFVHFTGIGISLEANKKGDVGGDIWPSNNGQISKYFQKGVESFPDLCSAPEVNIKCSAQNQGKEKLLYLH